MINIQSKIFSATSRIALTDSKISPLVNLQLTVIRMLDKHGKRKLFKTLEVKKQTYSEGLSGNTIFIPRPLGIQVSRVNFVLPDTPTEQEFCLPLV